MKPQPLLIAFLVSLLIAPVFLNSGSLVHAQTSQATPDFYIGIDVAYDNVTEIKSLIDEVGAYTNLFVIGCTAISHNTTKLDDMCQYLYDRGLSFIVYQEWPLEYRFRQTVVSNWLETAKNRWGDHFLGICYLDEPGGRQLDLITDWMVVFDAYNATDASNQFNDRVSDSVNWFRNGYSNWTDVSLFVSDYALYWFDYKAGYDTLLAQFGWNYSRQLNVALCRGAATVQNKDWGTIVAWEYTVPPYIESGEKLYEDLVLAYENGAKYMVVFDSDEEYTQTILKQEHLDALKQFWEYVQDNPRQANPVNDRVALVLPEGYAYGFRGPKDKIWGLWEANQFSMELSVHINSLLEQYGTRLDIIYEDGLEEGNNYGYSKLIHWSELGMSPYPYPSPNPLPSPIPSPTPTPTQSPSPSPTSLPSQSPSPLPSATQQPTSTPETRTGSLLPMDYVYAIAGGVAMGTIALAVFVLRKKAIKR